MKLPRILASVSLVALVTTLALVAVAVGATTRKPNLTVPRMVVPAHLEFGDTTTINVTVKNAGQAAAAATTVKLTLSTTSQPGRTSLGSARVGALAAGASQVVPVRVTVPTSASGGSKKVVACADPTSRLVESSETDNCRSGSVHVM
jgi:subtilase family serine protease